MSDNPVSPHCAICGGRLEAPYSNYPDAVCPACDSRALNSEGKPARHITRMIPPGKESDNDPKEHSEGKCVVEICVPVRPM